MKYLAYGKNDILGKKNPLLEEEVYI